MAQYLTSNSLIESVKKRAMIPESQSTFQTDDFLRFANEEMALALVPHVLSFHEDYFLYTEDVDLVASQSNYSIPYRAIGNKLREVSFVDNNLNVFEMSRIPIDDIPYYQGIAVTNQYKYYYVQNNEIILVPSLGASVSGTLRFSYYIKPNELVQENRVGVITNINTSTGAITLSSMPTVFSLSSQYDFIKVKSPHKTLSFDISATSIDTTAKTITFDVDDIPSNLVIGDHVALATETIIPQIPSDLHVMLAHRVAARCLEALGDTQGLQNANAKLVEMEQRTGMLIDNRVEAAPMKVVNRHGPLRAGLYRRRRWTFY